MALSAEIRSYTELREWLKNEYSLSDDDQALNDTLEGATCLNEMISALAREAEEREAMADAVKVIIAKNQARRSRHLAAVEAIRSRIVNAMQDAGLKKVPAVDVNVSVRPGKPRLQITDEASIPDRFADYAMVRSIRMDALKRAVLPDGDEVQGEIIEGVVVTNGAPVLTIRMS